MIVSVLASGSKGNAIFVEMDGARVLIDAGVGVRRVGRALSSLSASLDSLDAIFITHEHSDHVAGLRTLLRHTDAPVYTRPGTLRAITESDDAAPFPYIRRVRALFQNPHQPHFSFPSANGTHSATP